MGIDEAGTAKALREHRAAVDPIVRQYGGRIVKTTGDGLLLEFPSVVGAVECAVAVQSIMAERNIDVAEERKMLFRLGVNLGDVLIEGEDILGDGVNIAARLEGLAEPGGICISSAAHDQVRGRVSADFTDMGEQQLKNIARPVRVYQVQPEAKIGNPSTATLRYAAPAAASKHRWSIVVLPFANLSGDPEHEYFADGLTENLTTDLSRFRDLFVIARNTAFTFKSKFVDIKQIGLDLGVRYAVEGSVQRGTNRIRLNVQLIDTESGAHLWAERQDRDLSDLLKAQDEITRGVALALKVQLNDADRKRAGRDRPNNPDATDLILRALGTTSSGTSPVTVAQRLSLLDQAVALDPQSGLAWSRIANFKAVLVFAGWSTNPAQDLRLAAEAAERALAIDPANADAHHAKGQTLLAQKKYSAALDAYQQSLELNPSSPYAHQLVGVCLLALGRSQEAFAPLVEAARLSPRDPIIADFYMCLGWACWELDRYDEAFDWLERSIAKNPMLEATHFLLASTHFRMGRQDDARAEVASVLELKPEWTIRRARAYPMSAKSMEGIIADLRQAGLPE